MPISGHVYIIINQKSGTAFDLSGQDQRSIIGFTLHRSENQKWRFTQHDDGWTIRNLYNGKYLDVDIPNTFTSGERVVAVDTDEPRKWDVRQEGDSYRFFVPGTNQNIDLSDHGNPTPGTPVTLWGSWNGQNQLWRLEEA